MRPVVAAGCMVLAATSLATPARADSCLGTPRCDKQVNGNSYPYGIKGTAQHCNDRAAGCSASTIADVTYSWPGGYSPDPAVPDDSMDAFLAGIQDRIFTLPFLDTRVKLSSGWLYRSNEWHYALDYFRIGGDPFPVRAAAPGTVIFADWDPWSGNTVIVSHDVGGNPDAYRTIYMHMRNGPDNDCEKSWSLGVSAIDDDDAATRRRNRDKYKAHLNSTGCPEDPALRHPSSIQWGTDDQKLDGGLVGRVVNAGDQLGWAGATGPGGQKEVRPRNTHLHVFFARKKVVPATAAAPGSTSWYLFDPYGIYGQSHCYPTGVTERPSGYCVRLPVAWKDGRPQYPVQGNQCGVTSACPPGSSCTNGICAPTCTLRCPIVKGCFYDQNNACLRNEPYLERQGCSGPLGTCPPTCFRDAGNQCKRDVPAMRAVNCPLECVP